MKLSKTGWVILAIGILVITFGTLGATHSQRVSEGRRLTEELQVAKKRLSGLDLATLTSRQAQLQQQVAQTSAQLQAEQAALSVPNDSISITDAVFDIAAATGVDLMQISSGSLARAKVDDLECLVLSLSIAVKGDLPKLIDFIIRLNNDFPTGQVKVADLAIPGASNNQTDTRPSAGIQLSINAYRSK